MELQSESYALPALSERANIEEGLPFASGGIEVLCSASGNEIKLLGLDTFIIFYQFLNSFLPVQKFFFHGLG